MRTIVKLMCAAAAVAVASPAFAAPTITSAVVSGPTGTIWDTSSATSFYTLFLSRPFTTVLNPSDNFAGSTLAAPVNGNYDYGLAGDGFPTNTPRPPRGTPVTAINSDPFYTLTLQLAEGAVTQTLSGTYTPTTGVFLTNGPASFSDGSYMLEDFTWTRTLSNVVGSYSATNTGYDTAGSPGSGFDYTGAFTVSAVVPEPATWGLMIAGFGAVGAGLRARRRTAKLAIA